LSVNEHNRKLTIDFSNFRQDWLKALVKIYILLRAKSAISINTIYLDVHFLNKFSSFLQEHNIYNPEQIDLNIFESFDHHLNAEKLKQNTIANCYRVLSKFFDTCRTEKWLNINTYWFKGKKRIVCPEIIDYLPEEVWNQLDQNLQYLPEPIQRMVLLMRVTGIRVGELCNIPFDCLRKHGEKWHIRFTTEKYQVVDELPIVTPELVALIKEQQDYIRHCFGENYNKLFCSNKAIKKGIGKDDDALVFSPQPKVMLSKSFNKWLNRLARKRKICSKNGEIWHFKSHQFRRTVATLMTNAGVRDLIIQKYLRHRSPDMQKHYKHILTQVLGDEIEELMQEKKYVDITGKVVSSYKPQNPLTELMRRKMHQITTQYGECHRRDIKDECRTINACWRCEHWRISTNDLPYLTEDLERVEQELKVAGKLGMIRQQQGLEDDRNNLLNCIQGLE
jgi:integrase